MVTQHDKPVVIVGAGVIGLSIGWLIAEAGLRVVILERGVAGRGTSWLAAGMLAADAEIGFEEMDVYRLSRESLRRWSLFASKLSDASGVDLDLRTEETLAVADDPDSAEALRRVYQFQVEEGLDVQWLDGQEALEVEPFLAPRLAGAVLSRNDRQVDNRALVNALVEAFGRAGGELREKSVVDEVVPGRGPSVVLSDGEHVEAAVVVLAAGAWSQRIRGVPREAVGVRPVKGQMVQLEMIPPFGLSHVIRGPHAYLAPKSDGRLLVGATSEEMGFDTSVTAGGLYEILEGAWEIVPGIYDLPIVDQWAGLRPASTDHRPLLGKAAENVIVATGHYRHGILLTPITAEEITKLVLEGETSPWIAPFSPSRLVMDS